MPCPKPTLRSLLTIGIVSMAAAFASPAYTQDATNPSSPGGSNSSVIEDVRELTTFNAIDVRGSVDVVLVQTGKHRATVVGQRDKVPSVKTEVRDGTLVIDQASGSSWHIGWSWRGGKREALKAIVEVADLQAIAVTGSGDVRSKTLKAKTLNVSVSGSGDVKLAGLAADSLGVKVSGSGDVTVSGKVPTQSYAIAGSGDVRADQLEGNTVSVSIAGSGDARVWSTQSLKASVAGSGDVQYRGAPQVEKSIAGSGTVTPMKISSTTAPMTPVVSITVTVTVVV